MLGHRMNTYSLVFLRRFTGHMPTIIHGIGRVVSLWRSVGLWVDTELEHTYER
jgi:hypothetical protein